MPKLVRLYIVSVAIGFALAAVFVAALLWFDVAGLGRLTAGTAGGWLAVAMLVLFNGIVFAGVQFGIAVMALAEPEGGPRGGASRALVPVPVPVPSVRRRR